MKIKQFTPVQVIWRDARSLGGWHGYDETASWSNDMKQYTIISYGHVIQADKESIILCQSKDLSGNKDTTAVLSLLEIPRAMVQEVWEVKKKAKLW